MNRIPSNLISLPFDVQCNIISYLHDPFEINNLILTNSQLSTSIFNCAEIIKWNSDSIESITNDIPENETIDSTYVVLHNQNITTIEGGFQFPVLRPDWLFRFNRLKYIFPIVLIDQNYQLNKFANYNLKFVSFLVDPDTYNITSNKIDYFLNSILSFIDQYCSGEELLENGSRIVHKRNFNGAKINFTQKVDYDSVSDLLEVSIDDQKLELRGVEITTSFIKLVSTYINNTGISPMVKLYGDFDSNVINDWLINNTDHELGLDLNVVNWEDYIDLIFSVKSIQFYITDEIDDATFKESQEALLNSLLLTKSDLRDNKVLYPVASLKYLFLESFISNINVEDVHFYVELFPNLTTISINADYLEKKENLMSITRKLENSLPKNHLLSTIYVFNLTFLKGNVSKLIKGHNITFISKDIDDLNI